MSAKLAVFDIDGTLLDSCAIDAACYVRAVAPFVGDIHADWTRFADVTDEGVFRELLGRVPAIDEREAVQATMRQLLGEHRIQPIRGARDFVAAIDRDDDWRCAFATGAWESSARQKLHAAGITVPWPMATSDDSPNRAAITRIAIDRARVAYGCDFDDILLIGDGPWDRATALELALGFVQVGTTISDFADIEAVFATMRAACTGAFSAATATSVSSSPPR